MTFSDASSRRPTWWPSCRAWSLAPCTSSSKRLGIEDAGAIIELASTAQLERIFDDDLWRSDRIGHDERFDPERFGLWLEILLEAGEEFAVRSLTDLDPDIVTLGFCKLVLVVDVDRLAIAMANPGAYERMLHKAMESTLYHEFDQYQVIARNSDGWDAVLSILVALDRNHRDFLDRLLERCCAEIPIDPRPTSSRARNVQGPSARRQAAMVQAMDRLAGSNSKLHLERRQELNYLANVLVSGQVYQGRRLRPVEAADIVLGIIARGWEGLCPAGEPADRTLIAHSFVKAFRCGWRRLYDDAALPTDLDTPLGELINFRRNIS
jgi:hypothetical protein